jgi:MFS family permease
MRSLRDRAAAKTTAGDGAAPPTDELLSGLRADLLALALMLLFALAGFLTVAIPIARIELQDTFGLSSSDIGLLTSMYTFTYTAMAVPMGLATAKWGGRTLLVSLGIVAVGVLVFVLGSSFGWFLVGRFLQGTGTACTMPVATALISQALVPEKQGRAFGIFGAGFGAGTVAGFLVLRGVQEAGGYRAVFLVSLGVTVLMLVLVAFNKAIWRLPPHDPKSTSAVELFKGLGRVAANPRMWVIVLINTAASALTITIVVWSPGFLEDQRGALGLAAYMTAGLGVAQLLGNPAGAALMGRFGRPVTLMGVMAAMTVFTALVPMPPGLLAAFIMVLFVAFLSLMALPPVLGSIPEIVERPEDVGPAAGFMGLTNLIGMSLAPWIFGLLLDIYGRGPGEHGYTAGYLVLALFPLVGFFAGLVYWLVMRKRAGATAAATES